MNGGARETASTLLEDYLPWECRGKGSSLEKEILITATKLPGGKNEGRKGGKFRALQRAAARGDSVILVDRSRYADRIKPNEHEEAKSLMLDGS